MSFDLFNQRIQAMLGQLQNQQLLRARKCVQFTTTTECLVDGRRCISFASNDYLGLTRHPRILQAFSEAAAVQVGAGASSLIAGRSPWHLQLEEAIARFESTESAVLFASGFAANTGTLSSLIGPRDAVFCDRDNHASLIDGCRGSAGKFFVYDRTDLPRLEKAIASRRSNFDLLFLVTDTVFSMDGTLAPLPELCQIAHRFEATVIVDEAHATGIFGTQGRGVCELLEVDSQVAVKIGTLSKALGGLGGFAAGSQRVSDWLWNRARTQFFSTALPPAVCAAAVAALDVIETEPERRQQLGILSTLARQLLTESDLKVIFDSTSPSTSPIISVLAGEEERAVQISHAMLSRGFFIPAVRPPTVATGTARLRMSICYDHTPEMIQAAVYHLRDVARSEAR